MHIITFITIFSLLSFSATAGITKAKIKRGKVEIPVDLSQNGKLIRDYDVILLEEGTYSTLGNSSAKYVRVIGKGPGKTFISSSEPILVNSTEFWDVTMKDAQFKIVDVNGLWAINVTFEGAILVRPTSEDKAPLFTIRSIYSDAPSGDHLNPGKTPRDLLSYEDNLDRDKDVDFKKRVAYKGLIARAANYLYQTKAHQPHYDLKQYAELTKRARAAKAKGHIYVSMLTWAEADRLSSHHRFDEVLKEITPLQKSLDYGYGCSVEGGGLPSSTKNEIEKKLHAHAPALSLSGPCKIHAFNVADNKPEAIASARLESQLSRAAAFRAHEEAFQSSIIAHKGSTPPSGEDFVVGAESMVEPKQLPKKYTAVADVQMKGFKKTLTSEESEDTSSITENIINPITRAFSEQFASRIKAATKKIASGEIFTRMDGFLLAALYGSEKERQNDYEALHEQQFGRKTASESALGSVLSY